MVAQLPPPILMVSAKAKGLDINMPTNTISRILKKFHRPPPPTSAAAQHLMAGMAKRIENVRFMMFASRVYYPNKKPVCLSQATRLSSLLKTRGFPSPAYDGFGFF